MNSFPTLYKRTEIGQIQEWTITVDGNKYFTIEGIQNGKMTQSLPSICNGKNIGKKNETSGSEQAYKEAAAIYRKKIEVSGYYENMEDIDNDADFLK